MLIQAKKSIGRARCIICKKIIKQDDVQILITEYGGYARSCHFKCIEDLALEVTPKNYEY